jgi:hypothetical protein
MKLISSSMTEVQNKLECMFLASFFQAGLILTGKVRSLPIVPRACLIKILTSIIAGAH